ncbi:dynein regulatory complex protein 1 homolog [Teleopsis dalmanni]|uniref:dynein regulatory complex protein 1 homolog n=1 Tax=Teleopsis dalmanni TaxID=139649 RepID=UPI0018CE4B4C|nr:dynein regulatory complex protein 1 homolog [Teleopsis dalmanni]
MEVILASVDSEEWSVSISEVNALQSASEENEEEQQSEERESTINPDDIKSIATLYIEPDKISQESSSLDQTELHEELHEEFHEEQINLADKLNLLDLSNEKRSPYFKLDTQRVNIFKAANLKEKAGPKTLADEALEDKVGIERCLEENDKSFESLLKIGKELLDNIRVASEQREAQRRVVEPQELHKLAATIENESLQMIDQMGDIENRWLSLKDIEEPYETFVELEKQKKRLADILDRKDTLIRKCQEHSKRLHEQYFIDQKQKETDIEHFTSRVYAQVELIKDSYRKQMELLIEAIKDERKKNKWKLKWEKIFDQSMDDNQKKIIKEADYCKLFYHELTNLQKNQERETYAIKIRLEKAAEDLECDLQNTKAQLLKTSEITDYNYLILQNRFEENSLINILQKKRVAKVKRNILILRKQVSEHKIAAAAARKKMKAEIRVLQFALNDIEKQAEQMKLINKSNFDNVWAVNFQEMKKLITDIMNVERVIYEQMLGLPWENPEFDLTDINKPKHIIKKTPETQDMFFDIELDEMEKKNLLETLKQFSNRGGFIVEENILKALEPYGEGDQRLVTITQICKALCIKNENMIKSLTKFFTPYSYCPNCSSGPSKRAIADLFLIGDSRDTYLRTEAPTKIKKGCVDHHLVMEPIFTLTALNRFAKYVRNSSPYTQAMRADIRRRSTLPNLIQVQKHDIEKFWAQLSTYFTPEKENLWKCLDHGLNHYVQVLQQRAKLDKECEALRKQNAELNRLLKFLDT